MSAISLPAVPWHRAATARRVPREQAEAREDIPALARGERILVRTRSAPGCALVWTDRAAYVAAAGRSGTLLADGYSCRSQAKLIDNVKLSHPVQALLAAIRDVNNALERCESTPRAVDTATLHKNRIASEAAQKANVLETSRPPVCS